jgi:hypothetical protein
MTAYRQQALACAAALVDGPLRPRDLKAITPKAGAMLRDNYYGWFEKIDKGVYGLSGDGAKAVETLVPAKVEAESFAESALQEKNL